MASNINDLNEGFPYLNKALHLYEFRCEIIQTYSSIFHADLTISNIIVQHLNINIH